jgi:outer membrane receptor protein involved in Fe transport
MKLNGFVIMIVLLALCFSGVSQTVSLSGKGVPLKEIFAAIKSQTGILFFYDASLLKDAKPVTVELKNVSLEEALDEIFKHQPLTWVLENKTITIVQRPEAINSPPSEVPKARPIQVSGVITDVNGVPISDVTVLAKRTGKGTATDKNGKFTIEAARGDVMTISSVSYSPKETKVEGHEMNVKLELDVKPMESLVVGGNFSAMKRKAITTSITVLDSKTLERIPVNTLDQVFTGWVPGTNSFSVGDNPEGFPSVTVRGAAGATSLSTIAVYIDGIEYAGGSGYLFQLDKNNIDRIEIVRGPGAATMFGTGSNAGVIQIFTKTGIAGKNSVSLTSSAGFIKSKWVKGNPFQQMHNLETVTGFKNVALTLGGSYRTAEAYLPDGGEKNKGFHTGVHISLGKLKASLIARYNVRNFSLSRSPRYDTAVHPRTDIIIQPSPDITTPAYLWFSVVPTASRHKRGITETTITGVNLAHKTTGNWANNLDAGYTINNSSEFP